MNRPRSIRWHPPLWCAMIVFLALVRAANGQDIQDQFFTPETEILVEDYESWSLFLVCNPEWLVPESHEQLRDLYVRFQAFGRAIGPDHLAVWFWNRDPGPYWGNEELALAVDADRSAKYCEAFRLLPSEGPHVVVVTDYPDLDEAPEARLVIRLAESSPQTISDFLVDLTDKLLVEGLETESGGYWLAWFDAIRGSILGLGERVKVTIKAPWLEIELSGAPVGG